MPSIYFSFIRMQLMPLKCIISIKRGICYTFILLSLPSFAVSLSTQRIHLDEKISQQRFIITNKGAATQTCKLSLTHYYFNEIGLLQEYEKDTFKNDEVPENSAKSHFRYSPKNFDIKSNSRQTVRFVLRRKKDSEAKEYRSYLVVNCQNKLIEQGVVNNNRIESLGVKSLIVRQVPIIVRPKKITNATAKITNVEYKNNALTLNLVRQGDRSLYGKLEVYNRKTNKLLTFSHEFSLYTETNSKPLLLQVKGDVSPDNLLIKFVESKEYGGTIIAEYDTSE